jgi:AraC family transcriptional regulator
VATAFASVYEDEGVGVTTAELEGLTISELRFPTGYEQPPFEPDLAYVAVVLEGAVAKSFPRRLIDLSSASVLTIPQGATHAARFGCEGARILVVRAKADSVRFDRLTQLNRGELSWLAWRIAAELRATDAAAPLATAGCAFELIAATAREAASERTRSRPPLWLRDAEQLLRGRLDEHVGLGELAEAVGVHQAHLARAFRSHFGLSVGEYGRRLRLARAATELASTDIPLASIAAQAGFADQSHFTRVFKRHVGTTPARYREQTRSRTFQDR